MHSNDRQKVITFNNKLRNVSSPEKSFGFVLDDLSLNQIYRVGLEKNHKICNKLYEKINSINIDESLGSSINNKVIIFRKSGLKFLESRTYIHVNYVAAHGNIISALVRFIPRGEILYVGLNGYILPNGISWIKLFVRVFFTAIFSEVILKLILLLSLFSLGNQIDQLFVGNQTNTLIGWILDIFAEALGASIWDSSIDMWMRLLSVAISSILLWKTLLTRFWIWDKRIGLALRLEFYKELTNDQFDYDDIVMFSKSMMYTVSQAIREVFSSEGVSVESLDKYVENINNININTGGGLLQIIGSAIGIDNRVT